MCTKGWLDGWLVGWLVVGVVYCGPSTGHPSLPFIQCSVNIFCQVLLLFLLKRTSRFSAHCFLVRVTEPPDIALQIAHELNQRVSVGATLRI